MISLLGSKVSWFNGNDFVIILILWPKSQIIPGKRPPEVYYTFGLKIGRAFDFDRCLWLGEIRVMFIKCIINPSF